MTFSKTESFITFKQKIGRRLKPTDPDFVAPDGGWGWVIAFACGLSTLCIYSMLQQFGLVFTEKFHQLGITHTQTTTIININLALTSCIGLFNGPIYRRFSFRQVGLFGSSMVVCSLVVITICNSFWSFLVVYGLMFGTSIGLTLSANSLALNTYFKEKRSVATGFSWGITGIGPIVWPYVITILMDHFGSEGTVLLFAGFSAHAFLCALLLQPVHWHTKRREDTEVPLMPLRPKHSIVRMNSETHSILDDLAIEISRSISGKINEYTSASTEVIKNFLHDRQSESHKTQVPFIKQDSIISNNSFKISSNLPNGKTVDAEPETGFCKQLVTFFDLDIMKDLVYLNIIFGMISINFVEWNTTILTPGILKEFKFEKFQIATYMSLLAVTDVTVRFCIPFVARKLQWNNRIFYLLGAALTTTGRMAVLHTQQFHISLFMAVLVGIGRGLCIVYLALLIPTHVSLKKLPAALGIYLSFFGIFLILMAPVVGWIRDTSHSYVTTIHVLNILIYVAAISWILEYLTKRHKLNAKVQEVPT